MFHLLFAMFHLLSLVLCVNSVLRRRPSVPGKVVSLFESRTAGRAPSVCDTAL